MRRWGNLSRFVRQGDGTADRRRVRARKERQRSLRQLRSRSITPRRGAFAKAKRGPSRGPSVTNAIEAGVTPSSASPPEARLPNRWLCVPPLSPKASVFGDCSQARSPPSLRTADPSTKVDGCGGRIGLAKPSESEAKRRTRELERRAGCLFDESVADVGKRCLARGRQGSREANQAKAG